MPGSVINIENGAFQLCTSLTSVTIPGSVTSIGGSAFLDCTNLVSVTIPTSVTNIGEFAFEYCGLTNITIPGSVRSINVGVFAWCIALTNVTINQGVKSIGGFDTGAFESCTSLASVTFPNSLTNIGDYAFRTCTSLTSVLIPGSVTSIGILTFSGCTSLTSVYFTGNAPGVGADDDAFFEDNNVTTYYLPGMSGWSLTFWGYPSSGPPAVPWDPQIQASGANFGVQTNQFGFNLNWAAGQVIVVEACTNLASPVWVPLQTNTLVNGTLHFTDPGWTNYCARFYRITSP
jgi:hypothetical protein